MTSSVITPVFLVHHGMPVQTRSATHAPSMDSNGSSYPPQRQKRTKKSENEDAAARNAEVKMEPDVGEKREAPGFDTGEMEAKEVKKLKTEEVDTNEYAFTPGVIERGHIYFFYRPKVQREEVYSIDDVGKLQILLVPSPPLVSVHGESEAQNKDASGADADEMNLVAQGADAAPAPEPTRKDKKHFRLIIVGKKTLPDPECRRHAPIWATVISVGDNLHDLEERLGEKTYETKTRGTRHTGPVRLAGCGVYAIVNSLGNVPSRNATHLGYHLSHPTQLGDVQEALGIRIASSFVIQVKNPNAEVPDGQRVGLPKSRRAKYPEGIMRHVFGKGEKGRSSAIGLRFTSCNCIGLLDHEGAELLFIPARTGTEGNDQSLGNRRGAALAEVGRRELEEQVEQIFKELTFDKDRFPAEPLKGEWI
ncbi:uncharacterized protein EDB91DRAFT_764759 [Suillus paluster]|uniref:uncharacterized protein n=1 Tax=Suillus paluster TaxID=48578 RepID=UPI001B886D13|nr:uncharacterized protein EDB91DRAFT_764759 [Suillus paluster]KAG1749780.1 hypothetical protein EDB91DRAFT_764759 [Suillus paluster]